jgi:uncharacterized RDD family membrane protein YckC
MKAMEIGNESTQMDSLMYASLSRRLGAWFLDGFILGVMSVIAFHILPFIGSVLIWFFYAPILEASAIRATLGKHLMGIQVADLMGRRISFKAALIRNVMKVVSTAILFIGYFFAIFSSRKQTLHDILADTVVVYGRSDVAIADAWVETTKELFHAGQSNFGSSSSGASSQTVAEQLERLQALRDRGSLTQDEFEAAKRKILS